MVNRYLNRWGKLRQVRIPDSVIQNERLVLDADSLAVLLVLFYLHSNRQVKDSEPLATVRVGQRKLTQLTGYTINVITRAAKNLSTNQFIKTIPNRKKGGEFGTHEYILCRPASGEPLQSATSLLHANGVPYFTFPRCVVTEPNANWSLAKMIGSELRLYISVLWLANRARSNEFRRNAADLRKLSGLARATFTKSLDTLESRGLVWVTDGGKSYNVHLCDPYTGEPLYEQTGVDEDDAANYCVKGEDGQAKRLNLNTGNAEQIERVILSCLPKDEVVIRQGNGDLMICCRFHPDRNPSCSVSLTKHGCFHCFGCGKDGSLSTLIMQLRTVSRGEAIQTMADAIGVKVEYHQPDKNAIAIYSYRDENGKLLKQVLRYPDANGAKMFCQRRPAKGGDWIWSVNDLPSMLFNLDLLQYSETVCITEGEKDAQTITDLHLTGRGGLVIGMTSGGANSWDAQLARYLRGKRVVLMPDADEPGAKFAAAVKKSLEAEGIGYREVSFADVGAKDVTDFLKTHTVEELVRRIGADEVRMPNGQILEDDLADVNLFSLAEAELQNQVTL